MTKPRTSLVGDSVLKKINDALDAVYLDWLESVPASSIPPVFIVGVPRSGTTLLSQLLVTGTDIGFINNLTARFWKVPALAMALQKQAGGSTVPEVLFSEFGRTRSMEEPSEFGFFWNRWFDYMESHALDPAALEKVDANCLKREIDAMSAVYNRPILFKNLAACGMNAGFLSSVFPEAFFILVDRPPVDIARSLLHARITSAGDVSQWFSVKPPGFETRGELEPVQEVLWQIEAVAHRVQDQLVKHDPNRLCCVSYENMVREPDPVIARLAKWLGQSGAAVKFTRIQPDEVSKLSKTRPRRVLEEQIEDALRKFGETKTLLIEDSPFQNVGIGGR